MKQAGNPSQKKRWCCPVSLTAPSVQIVVRRRPAAGPGPSPAGGRAGEQRERQAGEGPQLLHRRVAFHRRVYGRLGVESNQIDPSPTNLKYDALAGEHPAGSRQAGEGLVSSAADSESLWRWPPPP